MTRNKLKESIKYHDSLPVTYNTSTFIIFCFNKVEKMNFAMSSSNNYVLINYFKWLLPETVASRYSEHVPVA